MVRRVTRLRWLLGFLIIHVYMPHGTHVNKHRHPDRESGELLKYLENELVLITGSRIYYTISVA